ncbi:hypothetical protein F5Y08DRAFT_308279 [Xylaria arbuscula]|nr:hypothetical protein F5Y08DRAFT_308279 [Xylaria arbuscula]
MSFCYTAVACVTTLQFSLQSLIIPVAIYIDLCQPVPRDRRCDNLSPHIIQMNIVGPGGPSHDILYCHAAIIKYLLNLTDTPRTYTSQERA